MNDAHPDADLAPEDRPLPTSGPLDALEPSPVDLPAGSEADSAELAAMLEHHPSDFLDRLAAEAERAVPPAPGSKDTNPKDGIGATKAPLHLMPVTAQAYAALALHNGRGKYGAHNWRIAGVRASIYLDALDRHVKRWINGEEVDPEDGVPNLGGAIACLCILIDARACGKLIDDRPPSFPVAEFFEKEITPIVRSLNEKHAGRNPRHYTIADTAKKDGAP